MKEVTIKASTVEEATKKALEELNAVEKDCEITVLEMPKKSLFGKTKGEAVVKVTVIKELSSAEMKLELAKDYLTGILKEMGLPEVSLSVKENNEGAIITFNGEGMAVLIGHHGETLDALQYLVALTCNRVDGEYYRITLDCGNYRDKREETLKELATRIAAKVKKTGRSQLLEPMNPYERRIIHAVVTDIEGVYSKSKGDEPNRRVVILSDSPAKVMFNKNTNRKEDFKSNSSAPHKPYVHKPERTMEEILKNDFKEKEDSVELYGKLDI